MKDYMALNRKFVAKADVAQKEAFIAILCTLADIDGKISPQEIHYIEELATALKTELKPRFFKCNEEICLKYAAGVTDRRFALELLKYMLALAYTDTDFSDEEGRFICRMSEALRIEPRKVSEISSWIIDRIIWLEQAAVIFEETENEKGGNHDGIV